jgi:hypothetical protein
MHKLQTASDETKKLNNVCLTFSASFDYKFEDLLKNNEKYFKNNLEEGISTLESIEYKINELYNIPQTEELSKLNSLNNTEKVIEERLKENKNEDECIRISQDGNFTDFI